MILSSPQDLGYFFLNLNDGLGLFEFVFEARILFLQSGNLLGKRIDLLFFSSPFFWGHDVQEALVPLSPPGGQVGGIQPFPPKKGAYLSGLGAGIGFLKYVKLVFGRKFPPGFVFQDFRVRICLNRGCINQFYSFIFHDSPT